MEQFKLLTSKVFVIPKGNIDTDQIIPGRFLTLDDRSQLGEKLFYDWRYDANDTMLPNEPLNNLHASTHKILVAGDNFGCGSSREHAVWALWDFGFRVIMSTSFADIFRNNALNNGLLPIEISHETFEILKTAPDTDLTVDLQACTFQSEKTGVISFMIDDFARKLLLEGIDTLEYILLRQSEITTFESKNRF